MIISRYLTKEVYGTLFATTILLLLIFASNQFARYLHLAASGELSNNVILLLMLLHIPILLSLLLPLSLFIAILVAYGRLYADNEMTILFACGVSPKKILKITAQFSLVIFLLVGSLSLYICPKLSSYSDQIVNQNAASILQLLQPNRFQSINKDKWIFYVDAATKDKNHLSNIFAANVQNHYTVSAQGGYQKLDPNTGDSFLVLTNGYRYSGIPGKKNFQIIKYDEYGIRLQQETTNDASRDESNQATTLLWQHNDKNPAAAELQWRISLPISVLVLAILGAAISPVKPRRGRFAQLAPAILLYIIYAQLLFLSRTWLAKGSIIPLFGMWWTHLIMLTIAFAYYFKSKIFK